jgi:hypothetical protein
MKAYRGVEVELQAILTPTINKGGGQLRAPGNISLAERPGTNWGSPRNGLDVSEKRFELRTLQP